MVNNMHEPEYLGDSVYAESNESGLIQLTTNNGHPDDPRNTIYIDGSVWLSLLSFAKRHKEDLGFGGRFP